MTIPAAVPATVHLPTGYFAPLKELRARLSTGDRLDIGDLVARFEWCYDARQFDALADMLTEDAVMDHIWGYAEGRDAVIQLLRDWLLANVRLRHQAVNVMVWGEPDGTAAACSYLFGQLMGEEEHDPGVRGPVFTGSAGHGLVTDRFRKDRDGTWRMTRRTIDQMYVTPSFLPSESERRRYALDAAARAATR